MSEPARRIEIFTGAGRRRVWPAEAKAEIIAQIGIGGATVSEVARRHGLTSGQLFAWRRRARRVAASPMTTPDPALDAECINTLRFLSVDALQKADSGHPGMPMGAASMAYVLWPGIDARIHPVCRRAYDRAITELDWLRRCCESQKRSSSRSRDG